MSQRKYALYLLKEYGVEKKKTLKLPLDAHMKLEPQKGTLLSNPESYRRLVGQYYLTISRPNIAFSVQLLSQFMQAPTSTHMQAARRVHRYLK